MVAYVIIPGIDGSDEKHWQTAWEARWGASAVRIAPASWAEPDLADWVAAIGAAHTAAVRRDDRVVLVAHSLGCWAAAEWLVSAPPHGVAAFLVAPPDPRGPAFPRQAAPAFADLRARPLPCPGLVVASDDDPYCDPAASAALADAWRVPRRVLAGHGHLNSGSGLGEWTAGLDLLAEVAG
ncbi:MULTISPECIES: RBBP9/YdeN family alpha/beta hydrolase [Amycolatopsis]|uniref:Alpha/beta hydrolase n=1 Tax=Amycolatopsis thermalba TaxID=944492 RepID=A0ABY4P2I1_9PSEU|nr:MULTISPECIES: alpha/beta hydrolase [Amycolatopsis]OXM73615.1 alpha/beta hydrolase [Amycolatopsis sp. KNN50.9b]UQS26570.1 alpha/beta hydrolase [Amycolatopsis thermalba]